MVLKREVNERLRAPEARTRRTTYPRNEAKKGAQDGRIRPLRTGSRPIFFQPYRISDRRPVASRSGLVAIELVWPPRGSHPEVGMEPTPPAHPCSCSSTLSRMLGFRPPGMACRAHRTPGAAVCPPSASRVRMPAAAQGLVGPPSRGSWNHDRRGAIRGATPPLTRSRLGSRPARPEPGEAGGGLVAPHTPERRQRARSRRGSPAGARVVGRGQRVPAQPF